MFWGYLYFRTSPIYIGCLILHEALLNFPYTWHGISSICLIVSIDIIRKTMAPISWYTENLKFVGSTDIEVGKNALYMII